MYPIINPNVVISKSSGIAIDVVTGKHIDLPDGAYPVMKLIDGQSDVDTIINKLMSSYKTSRENIYDFIVNMSNLEFITLSSTPQKVLRENKPPIRVASIEITERCNLRCRYCYGDFSPEKHAVLSYEETVNLFAALNNRNVRGVELTGGEPTVHPKFDEILNEACKQFKTVTIMTNAVILRQSTLDIYKKYREKVKFSISIDGFTEETNNYQRGVRNTFRPTIDNIVRIKNEVNPRYFRIVYMLTNENVDEVGDFFEFMLSHNIRNLAVSIPENIDKGRTYKLSDGCMMSDIHSKSRKILNDKIAQVEEKYGGRIYAIYDHIGEKGLRIANALPSCGAGWTMLSFQANGNVQPCNMMNTEWNLGNFKDNPNLDFLSFNNPLYAAFATINLSADNGNRADCEDCCHNDFCGKCISRIFLANQKRLSCGEGLCPILQKTKIPKEMFYR